MNILDSLIGNSAVNALCIALVFFTVLYNFKFLYTKTDKGTGLLMLWFVITVYSVFYSPIHSDNYASLESYYSYKGGTNEAYLHFESLYFRIMDFVPYGYVVWRFVIWGTGALLLTLYVKWMKFDVHVTTIALLYFSLYLLNYQRAIIGYIMLFIGVSMYVKFLDENGKLVTNIKYLLIAALCLVAALPFHNTMPFYILMVVVSVILPKTRYSILLCLGGIALLTITEASEIFTNNTFEETRAVAERYLDSAKVGNSANFYGIISQIISYGPFYLMLAYCTWNINSKAMAFNSYEKVVLTNTLLLVFIAIEFSSISSVIQGKFYTASLLPWGLFLSSYYTRNRYNKAAKIYVKVLLYTFIANMLISIFSGSFINMF